MSLLNLQRRRGADEPAAKGPILTATDIMTVGCWNVRTLYSAGALQILIQELGRLKWDIIGIAETHWTGIDDKRLMNYRILSSGREDVHRSGVGLILSSAAERALIGSKPVSDRIITARFRTAIGFMTIFQIYVPTAAASDQDMEDFYEQLQQELNCITKTEVIIIMGDFNAKVGLVSNRDERGAVGRFGFGSRNSRGDMLVDFCAANNLYITNTFFPQSKANRCWTWESPDGKSKNQIDFILVNKKGMGSVRNSRAFPSADVGSDHQLLMANMKLKLKRNAPISRGRKIDVSKLQDESIKLRYQEQMEKHWATPRQALDVEREWSRIKEQFNGVAGEVLGYQKAGERREWLSIETLELAQERRTAKANRSRSADAAKHHNYLCRQVKKKAQRDHERYVNQLCKEVEVSRNQNKSREVYEGIRKITGKYAPRVSCVKNKSGKILTSAEEIKTRWKEYFDQLYNDPNPVHDSNLPHLPEYMNTEPIPTIAIGEVNAAIRKLKKKKAVGIDGVSAEEIQAATIGTGLQIVHKLCLDIWEKETFPAEWKKAIIVPIYKKKDKLDCNNYRGVSLLCHISKVFTQILLQRMRARTDEILSEEQAGFRANRSTVDQIFTLRQLAEKYTEMNRGLYIGYIDFKKAFDSIWRKGLWRVLRNLGFPEKLVRLLENMYEGTFSAVRSKGELSDWFETTVGVLQGCVLSPLLFNIFLEAVIGGALVNVEGGAVVSGNVLNNLRFADDIAGISESNEDLQEIVSNISNEAERMGMKVNTDKTEVQYIGKEKVDVDILLSAKRLAQVDEFVYLGGKIASEATSEQDVTRRIGLASGVVQTLAKIWRAKDIGLKTKIKVYDTLVLSVLLYNAETWTLKETTKQRLRVFEMSCLRRIGGVTRRDRIRNTTIKERLGVRQDVIQRVAKERLRYFGHVMRMDQHRLPNIALHGRVHGQRNRGRPKKRWLDNIVEDCKELGITLAEAMKKTRDRDVWRAIIELPMRAQASPRH